MTDRLARGLGLFSLGLGVPQLAMPGELNRFIGVADDATSRKWQRIVGAREVLAAPGLLRRRAPAGWLWARVAGDGMDIVLLGRALIDGRSTSPDRTDRALTAVVGITAVDLLAALAATTRRSRTTHRTAAPSVRVL